MVAMVYDGHNVWVWTSPMNKGRMRGLCGDCNGEQWDELRTRDGRVLSENRKDSARKYIDSWRRGKC